MEGTAEAMTTNEQKEGKMWFGANELGDFSLDSLSVSVLAEIDTRTQAH